MFFAFLRLTENLMIFLTVQNDKPFEKINANLCSVKILYDALIMSINIFCCFSFPLS